MLFAFLVFIGHELFEVRLYDLCIEQRVICIAYLVVELVKHSCCIGIGVRSVCTDKVMTRDRLYNVELSCIKVCSS